MKIIKSKELDDFIYIKYYRPSDTNRISNKVLVIGFLRTYFKFKLFKYINIR